MSATPTPWETEPYAVRGAWIRGADKQWAALSCGIDDETAGDNAALIVRAVNAHDALVAALANTLALARLKWGNLDPSANELFERAADALKLARQP